MSQDWLDRGLTPREKAGLAREILAAYSRARWALWRTDLPTTLAALRAGAPERPGNPEEARRTGVRLGRAVGTTLRHIPFDSRCLMRSLVLTRLLAQRGIDSSLVIAVRSESDFVAHAWVERDGVPLLEPAGSPFSRIVEL
jgi:hypothetical protein